MGALSIRTFVTIADSQGESPRVLASLRESLVEAGGSLCERREALSAAHFGSLTEALECLSSIRKLAPSVGVGITLGEVVQGESGAAQSRCETLAHLAHPGQTLMDPAAREVARMSLPSGYRIVHLGDTIIGSSLSAEPVYQVDIGGAHMTFPPLPGHDFVATNIQSAPEGFIGRDAEAKSLRKDLLEHRLVTLIGPGGIGKSTLARWVAYDMTDGLRDGAWRVNLASVPVGGNLARAIAADLKLPGPGSISAEERILFELATMDALLILDNCEHLIPEAERLLPILLTCCPRLKILATSREPIACEGGVAHTLKSLAVPANVEKEPAERLRGADSVRLFLARMPRGSADLEISDEGIRDVARVCRLLDGMPLAIELAASHASPDTLAALRKEISVSLGEDALKGVGQDRRQSLDTAIRWSYGRLSEKQRSAFRLMSLLEGSWSLETACDLLCGPSQNRDHFADSVRVMALRSLLEAEATVGRTTRYRMLNPIRLFARSELRADGKEEAAQASLARNVRKWIAALKARYGQLEIAWLDRIEAEYPLVRNAIDWHLSPPSRREADTMKFASELYPYWIKRGPYSEGAEFMTRAVAKQPKAPAEDLAACLRCAGALACYAGDYAMSESLLLRSIETAKTHELNDLRSGACVNMMITLRNSGKLEQAREYSELAVELAHKGSDRSLMLRAYLALAMANAELGNVEASAAASRRVSELNEAQPNPWYDAANWYNAGQRAIVRRDTVAAEHAFTKSIEGYHAAGDGQGLLCAIERMGMLAIRVGNYPRAARLLGGTEAHFRRMGVGRPPADATRVLEAVDELKLSLGGAEAESLIGIGAALSLADLYDLSRVPPSPEDLLSTK